MAGLNIPPFTTVVCVDGGHIGEFRLAHQTWRKNRPEIWTNPLLVFVDSAMPPGGAGESVGWWDRLLRRMCDHKDMRVVGWPAIPGALSQRHRMLSAFVYGAAEHVKTPLLLKLDTDTLCLKSENRWHPDWFDDRKNYCYVTGAWSYTRGVEMWQRLLDWGKTVPTFDGKPEVPGLIEPEHNRVRHQRIISFFFLARMEFIRLAASLHPGPLMPIESQDTYLHYVATRLNLPRGACRIKKYGLHHGARGMEKRVKAILEEK